ncbi:hypothetical protein K440DRAFT_623654 [Wilcoxina mikolae CBS 423.85]|nr:hypothetical protein K440DRAFT_623654 [Wilcoxina mikolae CBS 423.85]
MGAAGKSNNHFSLLTLTLSLSYLVEYGASNAEVRSAVHPSVLPRYLHRQPLKEHHARAHNRKCTYIGWRLLRR